jgi:hypothetical protein
MKATYYPPNSRVVVLLPRDPYTRQRGVVVSTRNVGGDMEHRVRFADGATAIYYALALKAPPAGERGRGVNCGAALPA